MTSNRPYMIRALYQWIVDNDCTPHLLVNTAYPKVQVPEGYAQNDQMVLNVSPNAVRQLEMGNEQISFDGRFSGMVHQIFVPTGAVLAIYARENGKGMVFEAEPVPPQGGDEPDEGNNNSGSRPSGRPSLKVVK